MLGAGTPTPWAGEKEMTHIRAVFRPRTPFYYPFSPHMSVRAAASDAGAHKLVLGPFPNSKQSEKVRNGKV